MPAVVEADKSVAVSPTSVGKVDTRPWLAPYRFKKGQPNPAQLDPRAHRQPGTLNASTIYLKSLPKKARQWVKSEAPAVLIDARKIALPIDSDTAGSVADTQPILAFLAQHLTLIMAQPPSLLTAHSVEAQPGVTATPPSVSASAGTENVV